MCNNTNKKWCSYCKEEIEQDQEFKEIDGKFYHYSLDYLENCYFPLDEEDEY